MSAVLGLLPELASQGLLAVVVLVLGYVMHRFGPGILQDHLEARRIKRFSKMSETTYQRYLKIETLRRSASGK